MVQRKTGTVHSERHIAENDQIEAQSAVGGKNAASKHRTVGRDSTAGRHSSAGKHSAPGRQGPAHARGATRRLDGGAHRIEGQTPNSRSPPGPAGHVGRRRIRSCGGRLDRGVERDLARYQLGRDGGQHRRRREFGCPARPRARAPSWSTTGGMATVLLRATRDALRCTVRVAPMAAPPPHRDRIRLGPPHPDRLRR